MRAESQRSLVVNFGWIQCVCGSFDSVVPNGQTVLTHIFLEWQHSLIRRVKYYFSHDFNVYCVVDFLPFKMQSAGTSNVVREPLG